MHHFYKQLIDLLALFQTTVGIPDVWEEILELT